MSKHASVFILRVNNIKKCYFILVGSKKSCYNIPMFLKSFYEKYQIKYRIPYLDLADAGESNRIILRYASLLLFAVEITGLSSIFILHHSELLSQINAFIYYGVFILLSIFTFVVSRQKRDLDRKKVYIRYTVPLYVIMYTIFGLAIFNFMSGQLFNGFLTFCLTSFIGLCTCSFSPIVFLSGLVITIAFMSPGLYKTFGFSSMINAIMATSLMFYLSLYKRRIEKKHIQFLKKQKQNLEARTFGNFTLIYENQVVKFSRTKSDELLAYLIYKKGSSVKTKELIFVLFGRDADSARYGSNLRNLIVDIKHTLGELQIQNFFIAEYNNFRINPEVVKCDYYDFLNGDPLAVKNYNGEFLSQFSWAEEAASFLGMKALKK